jgi:formylglycine-generating enzyme required for sulfatase activity
VAALLVAIACVFAQAARFPLVCWDDHLHVDAPLSWLTRQFGYPIPLTVGSYALLGRGARAIHAWNVVFHAAVALLVLRLSIALERGPWPAILFAIHPAVAEPVAWATGRKDLLAAIFLLAAILVHIRRPRPIVTAVLYVLALACKPSALPLPAILWAYDRLLAPERKSGWLFALVPIAIADMVQTAAGVRAIGALPETPPPLWVRVPMASALEAAHLLAPVGLLPRYMPLATPVPIGLVASGTLVLAGLCAAPFVLRRRAKVAAFAVAFALLTFLPAADLLHRTRSVSDSYLYLPLAGLCLLLGSARVPRWAPPLLAAIYLPLCFLQVRMWRSNVSLFAPVADAYPDSPTAWKQLGDSYVCDGKPGEAVPIYLRVEQLFPGNTSACGNLGLAYAQVGDLTRAETSFRRGALGGDHQAAAHLDKLHGVEPAPMVKIPAGPFPMGCRESCSDAVTGADLPVHRVELSAFEIDRVEVSQGAYAACVRAHACAAPATRFDPAGTPELPVAGVTWEQARDFCAWSGKRLPSEAEWEKAARGDDQRRYPWGAAPPDCTRANFEDCGVAPKPVGSLPAGASPYGVLDLAGNVEEWVNDFYSSGYYPVSPARDPQGPASTGSGHSVRGGSYRYDAWHLGATVRFWDPGAPADDLGFRCAR